MPDDLEQYPHRELEQGYLVSQADGLQVRLRKAAEHFSLTFKRGNRSLREEREIQLTPEQFDILWPATQDRRLRKVRYDVPYERHTVEIDVYRDQHEGLIVAEVEFPDETSCASFRPPDWLGEDVSGDPRYSNQLLAS